MRQRWAIENEWHWVRDVQLGEDAHRYAERNGVQALALL
ncbi:MAG: transposase, partial [Prochlorococcaceae cyanobacterium]